jgi:RNA polymerase sigma-70 factor (ECF subfamily)
MVIFAYIRKHTATREDAEDLTLEVFLAALEADNLSTLSEVERLAWLKKVARHKVADYYRKVSKCPSASLSDFAETLLDEGATPEEIALQREQHGELYKLVRQLQPLQQQLLRLRYGEGLRCGEIAVILQKREEAIRQLLSRTLKRLRAQYDSHLLKKGK